MGEQGSAVLSSDGRQRKPGLGSQAELAPAPGPGALSQSSLVPHPRSQETLVFEGRGSPRSCGPCGKNRAGWGQARKEGPQTSLVLRATHLGRGRPHTRQVLGRWH